MKKCRFLSNSVRFCVDFSGKKDFFPKIVDSGSADMTQFEGHCVNCVNVWVPCDEPAGMALF